VFLNNVIQCIPHNVAAMILLHTVWVAELNFQVSLLNELSAEIIMASSCLAIIALNICDVLIQAAHVYTVRILTDRNRDVHVVILYIAAT